VISIGIIHLSPSDIGSTKDIIERTNAVVLPTRSGYTPPSLVVFQTQQEFFTETVDAISADITSISRVSEIRNVNSSIIEFIGKTTDSFPENLFVGILECKGIETTLSSANAISFLDEVNILQITLSNDPQDNSIFIFSGEKEEVEKALNSAKKISKSTGQVIEKYKKGD